MRDTFGVETEDGAFTSSSNGEETEDEPEQPVDELELHRIATDWKPEELTLVATDYEPRDLVFPDRYEATIEALVHVCHAPVKVVRLTSEEYEAGGWAERIGAVHLFPDYVIANTIGSFRLFGNFLRQMYIIERVIHS
jgi:hypothetical protein